MIIAFLDRDYREWDIHLKDFRFAYNIYTSFPNRHFTCFFDFRSRIRTSALAMYQGVTEVEPRDAIKWEERMRKLQSLYQWVREDLNQARQQQAKHYNLHRRDLKLQIQF